MKRPKTEDIIYLYLPILLGVLLLNIISGLKHVSHFFPIVAQYILFFVLLVLFILKGAKNRSRQNGFLTRQWPIIIVLVICLVKFFMIKSTFAEEVKYRFVKMGDDFWDELVFRKDNTYIFNEHSFFTTYHKRGSYIQVTDSLVWLDKPRSFWDEYPAQSYFIVRKQGHGSYAMPFQDSVNPRKQKPTQIRVYWE